MPAFGRAMLEHWLLDPDCTYLNHGTVGAPPRRVLEKQQAIRNEIERQPSRFLLRELSGHHPAPWRVQNRLRDAAEPVAAFLGARADDLVFVPNVTTATNAVLRSLPLGPGDEILISDLAYGALTLTARAIAEERGATVRVIEPPFPPTDAAQMVDGFTAALTPKTKLAIVDHVTAQTALVLPVKEVAAVCHQRGVPVLVDGAHAPGSIAVDLESLGVDWYGANLHKWAYAPRSCGFLWAAADRQALLHYPVVSWGHGRGFHEEFELVATSDPSNYLAAPEGMAILCEWGFDKVLAYMHGLAWDAAHLLAERWSVPFTTPRTMVGAMVTVPLPARAGSTDDDANRLRLALLVEDHIEVQLHAWHGQLWVRLSLQVYNELGDVAKLAEAVLQRLG